MNRGVLAGGLIGAAVVIGALFFVSSRRPVPASGAGGERAPVEESGAGSPRPEAPPALPAPVRRAPGPAAAAPEGAPAEAEIELGTLRVETDVPGAQVFIDRQFVGTAPLTVERVRPGTHQLNISAEGFDGIAQAIDVEPGPRDLTFRFREVRLDASLAVVHRHRMGSCRGRLVATADGLTYETEDRDDGFAVPLRDLEAFQVDYQEKTLRVRLRKGKQFNFTDPDGNADRLFVFHRDVDKARQRVDP